MVIRSQSQDLKEREVTEISYIPLEQIRINPYQPRRTFSEENLQELANSIRLLGVLQPPLVRRVSEGQTYELIAGERRCRAARLAGLKEIPVIICAMDTCRSAEAALVENIQRMDLNPLEIAHAIQQLMRDWGFNQDEVALKVGKQRSTIANYLRLLALPAEVQEHLSNQSLSMGHAKAILALSDPYQQKQLAERILTEELNVRQAEALARRMGSKKPKPLPSYEEGDLFLHQLAQQIQRHLGTKVRIRGEGTKGELMLSYYSLDDLDRLLEVLGVKEDTP